MFARLLPLTAAIAALLAGATEASARVSAEVVTGALVVDGTALHDVITITFNGTNLRVDDRDRVDANAGCTRSGEVALCPRIGVAKIRIHGNGSDDSIQVSSSVPVPIEAFGDNGDDTVSVFAPRDGNEIRGGEGDDALRGSEQDDELHGEAGNDTLEAGDGADKLFGLAGADTLRGGPGDDELVGGTGPDTVVGDAGTDLLSYVDSNPVTARVGTTGNGSLNDAPGDTIDLTVENLSGGTGGDTLVGAAGPNTLLGNQGDDTLDGAGGDDLLKPALGNDVVRGGAGRDTVFYDYADSNVQIAIGSPGLSGTSVNQVRDKDSLEADVEDAVGGSSNDKFFGTPAANRFKGGEGFDTFVYLGRTAPITADADGQPDDGEAGEGDDIETDVEGIEGGAGNDNLTATESPDGALSVFGPNGVVGIRSRLFGGAGADVLHGTDGVDDNLVGGPGNDQLLGGDGKDLLEANGDGEPDSADCGAGAEDFAKLDLVDTPANCEIVQTAAVGRHPTVAFGPGRATLAGRVLRVGLTCPRAAADGCQGSLEAAGAKAPFAVPRGARRTVRVKLGATAARRVRRAGRVRLTATEKDPEGRPKTSRALLRLR